MTKGWRTSLRALGLAGALVAAGCGDQGPEVTDLTGRWSATSAVVTNPAVPTQSIELVTLGLDLTLTIADDGGAETRIAFEGEVDVERGTIVFNGEAVTLTLDGVPNHGTWRLAGETLTLDLRSGIEFDFEGSGEDEPALLRLELVREAGT